MAVTKTDVILIAPELAGLSDDTWTALIADAALQMDAGVWGAWHDLGQKYLVAHMATLVSRRGAPAVSSQTVGPISVTYAASSTGSEASPYDSTAYGREYRRLLRAVSPRMAVL